ncbi:MAG: hypothetical protein DME26_00645, partial [Verrucomicrobia bacterium]
MSHPGRSRVRARRQRRASGRNLNTLHGWSDTLFVACLFFSPGVSAWAKGPEVRHEPQQPKSAEVVRITARFTNFSAPGDLVLQYQVIDPGKYIALGDREFEKSWAATKMDGSEQKGAKTAGASLFTAELPASIQKHRRLVRYRIVSARDNKIIAPGPDDAQPNFAYFVYDGVPAWKGAINPKSPDPKLR